MDDEVETKEKTLTAEEALDAILDEEARQDEARQVALVREQEEEHARRQRQNRRDLLAVLEEDEVRRRCRAGTMTAEDVELWAGARQERLRRAAMQMGCAMFSAQTGLVARLVEGPGGLAIAVTR